MSDMQLFATVDVSPQEHDDSESAGGPNRENTAEPTQRHDESEHRITPAWARIAPRLNSLGRVVAFRAIPMASFSCQAHIRRACDAGVRVLVYGRRRQERRGQGAPSGGVSWPRSGRGTVVVGSRGAVRSDAHEHAHESRAWRPRQFSGKRGCLREGRIYQPASTKTARAVAWLR